MRFTLSDYINTWCKRLHQQVPVSRLLYTTSFRAYHFSKYFSDNSTIGPIWDQIFIWIQNFFKHFRTEWFEKFGFFSTFQHSTLPKVGPRIHRHNTRCILKTPKAWRSAYKHWKRIMFHTEAPFIARTSHANKFRKRQNDIRKEKEKNTK